MRPGTSGLSALFAAALLAASVAGQAAAQDGRSRLTGLKLSGDKPITIESDRLEVRENENVAIFTGNVTVAQEDTLLKAGKMTVHYANAGRQAVPGSGNIERMSVEGKVYIRSREQVATGDRGTFDMGSQVLVLTGNEVMLTEGPNIIVGCRLTVQMRTGEAKLDGCDRVKMLLQPNSRSQ